MIHTCAQTRAALPALRVLLLLSLVLPAAARAAYLDGAVTDALTGEPIEGAVVRLAADGTEVETGADGAYLIHARSGAAHILEVEAAGYHVARLIGQGPGHPGAARLLPLEVARRDVPSPGEEPLFGVPWHRTEAAAVPGGEIRLPLVGGPLFATMPEEMPETIRVGRRFASTCSGNPVQEIDEMSFEDYVAGVLPPEIGVFKSVPGGPESSRSVFAAFAVLARTYGLWWYLTRGADAEWHIDDTACEQRYDDHRDEWISEVALTTAGQVLVKAADPTVIDKYEYAASCGRHGTRPAHQTEIIPDDTPGRGCTTGGWCGHDNCAAHETNPNVSPSNRCLVRGVCQWGSLERSLGGHEKNDILGHYQPNLLLLNLGAEPTGSLVGLVLEGDVQEGDPIAGATVTLCSGEYAFTDEGGMFRFDDLEFGRYELLAEAPGYLSASRLKDVDGPGDHWASLALMAEEDPGEPDEPDDPAQPDPDDSPEEEDGAGGGGSGIPDPGLVEGGCACGASGGSSRPWAAFALLTAFLAVRPAGRRASRRI